MRAHQPFPAARKDVQEAARWLRELGWEYVGMVGGHFRFEHPEFAYMTLPSTPGTRQWQDAKRGDIAKAMGITRPELEVRLGLREKKNPNRRKRERNVEGVQARKFKTGFTAETKEDAKPTETTLSLVEQIKEANDRLGYLPVGSWLYRSAQRELARLRVEYMETEGEVPEDLRWA